MIIDIHEKYDVSPEWFEEQLEKDECLKQLCKLLSIYKVHDADGAKEATEKIKAVIDRAIE